MSALTILRAGAALVQDLGRPGYGSLGVGISGAADRGALIAANRLVGNADGAAGLEVLLGGLQLQAQGPALLSLTGAPTRARIEHAGSRTEVASGSAFELPDGALLTIRTASDGLRIYLAVAGGMDVPAVLGSRSTDTLSGIGPAPLGAGDRIPVGELGESSAPGNARPEPGAGQPRVDGPGGASTSGLRPAGSMLEILAGPHFSRLRDPGDLTRSPWLLAATSNRIGLRLEGDSLPHTSDAALASEPMVRGAIQLPPSGLPVVLGPDYPVTGGYPVIGVLTESANNQLAQCRPGRPVHFRWADS